jgi:catechol-2,3-dioxygenase
MEIKQVELLSPNLTETEKFYNEILGLEIREKTENKISFVVGISSLVFKKTESLKPIYHFAFNIPNNKLDEAEKWISSKVSLIEFEDKPIIDFPNWNAKSLYFADSNGNILEFIARFDLENTSKEIFDSSSMLSISEIAFVTENVNALARKFISKNKFKYFDKQVQRNDFSVIGEESGLLIIVDSERDWFPTNVKAENFWMKIEVENDGKLIELENK